jgi:hypothetical protein
MDINRLQQGFTYVLLERVDREQAAHRFDSLAWQPSLVTATKSTRLSRSVRYRDSKARLRAKRTAIRVTVLFMHSSTRAGAMTRHWWIR